MIFQDKTDMSYIQTFLFGLTLAISIGPIAILILNQSINCGLKNGALCGLGAATADLTYAIVAFTAGSFIFHFLKEENDIISFVSSGVLILFSIWMMYTTLRKKPGHNANKYGLTCRFPFVTTYGLTIGNPLTIVVFAGFAGMVSGGGKGHILIHVLSIFIASLSVQLLIAFVGSKLAHFISRPSTIKYFNLVSALGIGLFGISKLI